jgi:hypothetical protein
MSFPKLFAGAISMGIGDFIVVVGGRWTVTTTASVAPFMRACSARVMANVKCEVPDQTGSERVGAGGTVLAGGQARRGGTIGCRGARA